jgi:hypothetical protein
LKTRLSLAVLLTWTSAVAAHAQTPDGLHTAPNLGWRSGDHRADLWASIRARGEYWDAFVDDEDVFYGIKTRLKAQYAFREQWIATAEGQFIQIGDMDRTASGVELVTRNANRAHHDAGEFHLRQAHLEWKPVPSFYLRAGRQDTKLGSEIAYTEPDWKYLKNSRLGERLIGTVGWSHVERAFDAIAAGYDFGGHRVDAIGGRPTTGVFEVDQGMRPLHDIAIGSANWTVKRGTWLDDTELTFFGVFYDDERPIDEGGIADELTVYTAGASWLGVYELGPGRADVLLWGAGQWGEYAANDHLAAAGIAEFGYQLSDVFAKPWQRVGVNVASGDGDPTDHEHDTFFNLLPTNHLYYGFADQLAFQNLINPFVQLRLTPHPKLWVNLFVHWFQLMSRDDFRYAGTGAFERQSFGFPTQNTAGQKDVGIEYDAVVGFNVHRTTTIEFGFSWLDGGDVWRTRPDRDAAFAYAMVEFKY